MPGFKTDVPNVADQNADLHCEVVRARSVDPASGLLPSELIAAFRDVYGPAGLKVTKPASRELESSEYGACRFDLEGHTIAFRVAKTTPTKIGQFVTIWQRPAPQEAIAPLHINDGVSFVVVAVSDATHHGQFVFGSSILVEKKVMSCNGHSGKRAIRVYPPWTRPTAREAIKTQQWQLQHFLKLDQRGIADPTQVRDSFSVNHLHKTVLA